MKMRSVKSSRTSVPSRNRPGGHSREIAGIGWAWLLAALLAAAPARGADIQLLRVLTPGTGESQPFTDITGLQLDANGTLILADGASGRVLNVQGEVRESFAAGGKQRLFGARALGGVARLGDNLLAVVRANEDRVAVLDNKGALRFVLGEGGSDEGRLSAPAGLAASVRGRLYVADRGNQRVNVYTHEGLYLFSFTGGAKPAALNKPTHVAVDAEERIYVLDGEGDGRVSVFDHSGRLLKQIGARQFSAGEARPVLSALTVDAQGFVVVADRANGKLIQYDWQAGKAVQVFGSRGRGRGQFTEVTSLAVNAGGMLAAGDSGNPKVEIYQLPMGQSVAGAATPPLEALRLPTVRRVESATPGCDQAFALPAGELLCLSHAVGSVTRLGKDRKVITRLAGTFRKPLFAVADARAIAVVDGDEVKVFALDGRQRFSIGRSGSGDGEFDAPAAVVLADRIYVSDTGNRRVQIFSRDGVFLDKLVNPKGQEWLRKPGALAVDAQRNLYVADNGARRIRVFSDRKELLYEIGADDKSPQGFETIRALALDSDEHLHVLAGTGTNRQMVQMYAGPKLVFRFGSGMESAPGFVNATSLSLVPGAQPAIAVFDAGPRQLKSFAWLQVPNRVGGLAVQGGLTELQLRWQKAPGSQVARYRVYGAVAAEGPYLQLKDTAETTLVLARDTVQQAVFYRVSALSGHGVEGNASQAREDMFQSGFVHYEAKRHAEAAQRFAQAWKEDSRHALALEYLGRSLAAQGLHAEAVRHFQELARLEGFAVAGVNLQAETLWQAREYPAARAVLEPLVSARRGDAVTYSLCGQVALALGDTLTAADCLEQSLKRNRDNAQARLALGQVYLRMGAVANGLSEIDAAAALAPQSAAFWLKAGEAYQSMARHKEAIDRFQRAVALDGASSSARLGAARSHIALKEYEPARAIARSLAGGADEAAGQYLLGAIALALKEPQDALLALSKAANRDPKNSAVWLALAEAQRALKNDAEARTALQRAVNTDPVSFEGFFRLGLLEQDNRQHVAAVGALEKAIPLQPANAEAHLTLAASLLALDRFRDATEHAREAAKLAPKRIEPLLLIADGTRAQGKYGEAIETLKKAVSLSADSSAVQLRLGQVYLETDVYDAAQTHLERAALLEPKNPAPHDLLGQMYLERCLFDAAIKAFTQATDLDSTPEYQLRLNTAYAEKKKSLEFSANAPRLLLQDLRLERVFSAAYKRYADQPVGAVKVSNASGTDYKNLKLAFHIKGYMDFPHSQEIVLLPAGSSTTLPLHAAFNNKVLGIDEDTGVQVEVKLSYTQDGQPGSIELTRPMTLYGKNAIQWVDFRSVGAFVTPKDDTLKDFVRQAITQYQPSASLNRPLLQAMTLFDVLAAHGLRYQVDPNNPYSKMSGEQVDYVQFPRETLKLKSGDCDDLSVLLAAALENLGIETALVDVPGHLFLLFNTGVPAAERDRISLQDDQLVIRANQVWVPLESTLIATSFAESWAEGARKLQEAQTAKTLKVVPLKEAWAQFQPVTLAPAGYSISLPTPDKVQPLIERERRILVSKSLERQMAPYRVRLAASPNDPAALLQIAILNAQNGLYDLAFREFDKLLAANPRSAEAHNNRGNIYYTLADYDRAFEAYAYAEELDPADGGIKLNLALTHYQRGRLKEAIEKYREAVDLNKLLTGQYLAFEKLLLK